MGFENCSSFPLFTLSCFIVLTLKVPEQQQDNEDRKVSTLLLCCSFSLAELFTSYVELFLSNSIVPSEKGFYPFGTFGLFFNIFYFTVDSNTCTVGVLHKWPFPG